MNGRFTYIYPRLRLSRAKICILLGIFFLLPSFIGTAADLFGALPHDPAARIGLADALPSGEFWLGTDALGRDLFSRLASASANFALPGLLAVAVALCGGTFLGVLGGGLAGKPLKIAAGWLLQVLDGAPKLIVVLLAAAITMSNISWIMIAVGATFCPQIAGAIMSSIERLRAMAFIEAEKSLGVGAGRIIFYHILWSHARRLILAQISTLMAYALLIESSLSYLGKGLGIQEPAASWGNMLDLAKDGFFAGHALPAILPAAFISLSLLGFNMLGLGLLHAIGDQP